MLRWNPYHRCDAATALKNWRRVRNTLRIGYRGARLVRVPEERLQILFYDTRAFLLTSCLVWNRVLARIACLVAKMYPVL